LTERDTPVLYHADDVIAFSVSGPVTRKQFFKDILAWSARLPQYKHIINLCHDRYLFMVGFMAAARNGQCSLLIPGRQPDLIQQIADQYEDLCILHDTKINHSLPKMLISHDVVTSSAHSSSDFIAPDADTEVAIVFTSGSTGLSMPVPKTWHALAIGAQINFDCLPGKPDNPGSIIATVPISHMYGLEWSLLVPVFSGIRTFVGNAFFPQDIKTALECSIRPRILVSTPFHLRALLRSGIDLPQIDTVMSATAPMSKKLAQEVENRLGCRVLEIYGCSEIGSMASRYPAKDSLWRFFSALHISHDNSSVSVTADHFAGSVELADTLEFAADGTFKLCGRDNDLVKIAGKRASLDELTARLLEIEGVVDGAIFEPEFDESEGERRLAALVVAPGQSPELIRQELSRLIDPVFLPRPLLLISELRRQDTSKLRRVDLNTQLGEHWHNPDSSQTLARSADDESESRVSRPLTDMS